MNKKQSMHDVSINIDIDIDDKAWNKISKIMPEIINIIGNICLKSEKEIGFPMLGKIPVHNGFAISVLLTNDETITKINNEWRGKNKATNILSFPNIDKNETPVLPPDVALPLGDMILSFETIEKEAIEADILFMDHLNRLLVHGIFHLLGYDHIEENDYQQMVNREIYLLLQLGIQETVDLGYISLDLCKERDNSIYL